MIRKLTLALMMSGSVLAVQAPAFAQSAAPVSKLVEAVNIPHGQVVLNQMTPVVRITPLQTGEDHWEYGMTVTIQFAVQAQLNMLSSLEQVLLMVDL